MKNITFNTEGPTEPELSRQIPWIFCDACFRGTDITRFEFPSWCDDCGKDRKPTESNLRMADMIAEAEEGQQYGI